MHRIFALLIITSVLVTGCSSARYVSRNQEQGIIAIPSTSTWPVDHREKAMELMQAHFPQGYVIEKEEEFVIGTETQNHTDVHAHEIGNSNIFLGGETTHTTTTDKTEWRITYRRANNPRVSSLPEQGSVQ
ncbi:MAG: hypothetical protein CMJ76_07740 [Planctomycetaceae bacterium]|nr:hypothetical protein [Planctomycetaceae bacterium]|tara:strand:+ start:243 stop:635 length:393 start_codon:yes stop_codon:yes gene_type:complete